MFELLSLSASHKSRRSSSVPVWWLLLETVIIWSQYVHGGPSSSTLQPPSVRIVNSSEHALVVQWNLSSSSPSSPSSTSSPSSSTASSASAMNASSEYVRHIIRYGVDGNVGGVQGTSLEKTCRPPCQAVIGNLMQDTSYGVIIIPFLRNGAPGPNSKLIFGRTTKSNDVPDVSSFEMSAQPLNSTTALITWDFASTSKSQAAPAVSDRLQGFVLYYSEANNDEEPMAVGVGQRRAGPTDRQMFMTRLIPDSSYRLQMTAQLSNGDRIMSKSLAIIMPPADHTPDALNMTQHSQVDGRVLLEWDDISRGDNTGQEYHVVVSGSESGIVDNITTLEKRYTLSCPDQQCDVHVRQENAVQWTSVSVPGLAMGGRLVGNDVGKDHDLLVTPSTSAHPSQHQHSHHHTSSVLRVPYRHLRKLTVWPISPTSLMVTWTAVSTPAQHQQWQHQNGGEGPEGSGQHYRIVWKLSKCMADSQSMVGEEVFPLNSNLQQSHDGEQSAENDVACLIYSHNTSRVQYMINDLLPGKNYTIQLFGDNGRLTLKEQVTMPRKTPPPPLVESILRISDETMIVRLGKNFNYPNLRSFVVYYTDQYNVHPGSDLAMANQLDKWLSIERNVVGKDLRSVEINVNNLRNGSIYAIQATSRAQVNGAMVESKPSTMHVVDVPRATLIPRTYSIELTSPWNLTRRGKNGLRATSIQLQFYFENQPGKITTEELEIRYMGSQTYNDSIGYTRRNRDVGMSTVKVKPSYGSDRRYVSTMSGLQPNMNYQINVSSVYHQDNNGQLIHSYPSILEIQTDYDAPPYIEAPYVMTKNDQLGTVLVGLKRVSEKNGPINKYYIVVAEKNHDKHLMMDLKHHSFSFREPIPGSGVNTVACFHSKTLPESFMLGTGVNTTEIHDGRYMLYHNVPLLPANIRRTVRLCVQVISRTGQLITDCSAYTEPFTLLPQPRSLGSFSGSSRMNTVWMVVIAVLAITTLVIVFVLISHVGCCEGNRKKKKIIYTVLKKGRPHMKSNNKLQKDNRTVKLDYHDVPLLLTPDAVAPSHSELSKSSRETSSQLLISTGGRFNGSSSKSSTTTDQRNQLIAHHDDNFEITDGSSPILVANFIDYANSLKANGGFLLSQEFESIDPDQPLTWTVSTRPENRQKNRYANILSYDHSRVCLKKPIGDSDTVQYTPQYINANYIDGYKQEKSYIATQGPLPNTFDDFWQMVWQDRVQLIVMVTRLEERNRLKCDLYWPMDKLQSCRYGNIDVALSIERRYAYFIKRVFRVTFGSESRLVKHYQFTAWPDHGVPDNPFQFISFLRLIRSIRQHPPSPASPDDSGFRPPVVVHCSAGVGRTGCLIALDWCCDQLVDQAGSSDDDAILDLRACLTLLRQQRNYMVQTEDQLSFVYDCLCEIIRSYNGDICCTEIKGPCALRAWISQMNRPCDDDNFNISRIEAEFKRLAAPPSSPDRFKTAHMVCNKFKNRLVNIVPYEESRVVLLADVTSNQEDATYDNGYSREDCTVDDGIISYINASYVDSYCQPMAFIATQGPLPNTIDDFWRMTWQSNCSIVVMITNLVELGKERCAQYWPLRGSQQYGVFQVDTVAEYRMPQYILREWRLISLQTSQQRTVRQFHFLGWPEQGVPRNTAPFLEFMVQIKKTRAQFGLENNPLIVHGSSGVGRTGVFVALMIVTELMEEENLIDMFTTVKLMRAQRPAMIQTEDQYQFCYRVAQDYVDNFFEDSTD